MGMIDSPSDGNGPAVAPAMSRFCTHVIGTDGTPSPELKMPPKMATPIAPNGIGMRDAFVGGPAAALESTEPRKMRTGSVASSGVGERPLPLQPENATGLPATPAATIVPG